MQSFAVIGLGRFGARLASNLAAAGREVIGIDRVHAIVEQMRDRVTLAVRLDATDEEALREKGVHKVDVAVVGIGDDFESTILATVILKQLGVPRVVARAPSPTAARILSLIGADEVVNPEDESADRWATRLLSPHFLNQIEFHEGHSIVEVPTPAEWAGKTLAALNLRARTRVHVVALKRPANPDRPEAGSRVLTPAPDEPLREGDTLILMGRNEDLAKIPA